MRSTVIIAWDFDAEAQSLLVSLIAISRPCARFIGTTLSAGRGSDNTREMFESIQAIPEYAFVYRLH
jgi:hypothetical protein